jgi:hypothetical protein
MNEWQGDEEMKLAWRVVVIIGAITACGAGACLLPSCGRGDGAVREGPALRGTTVTKTDIPLPEWAPEDPSPEFLRAAKVLRPYAEERAAAPQDDLSRRTARARYTRTLTAAWEFFGTLSDDQIERLLAAKELQMTMRTLTETQRTALYHYFDVYREVMEGVSDRVYGEDPLVELYKFGAKEDLSNVEIQFLIRASGIVGVFMRVRQPDGSLSPPLPAGLGRI